MIQIKDAVIPKVVPNAQPSSQGSVPREPPSVLVALKPPGGNGLPKYVLRSADGNGIPNTSLNKAVGNQSPNQSENNVFKIVVYKMV